METLNFEEIVKKIEEKFKLWEKKEVDIEVKKAEFKTCFVTKNKDTEQVNLAMSLEAIPAENNEEAYALAVSKYIYLEEV